MDIFEKATKKKLRFKTVAGNLAVEDLWDLPLLAGRSGGPCLNDVAKDLNHDLKGCEEESFVDQKTTVNATLTLGFDVVKRVIEVRLADQEKAEKSAATRAKKQQLLAIIADKEVDELKGKSAEDLKKLLEEM